MSKSNLFKTAWSYLKQNLFSTFSECLKAAWLNLKLRAALKIGKVILTFKKKDGSYTAREATTNSNLFSYESKGRRTPKLDVISFFSLTDDGFRSTRIENVIHFQNV